MTEMIDCCPYCDSARFSVRGSGIETNATRSDADYYCRDCQADFDDPDTREGKRQPPRQGPAADLLAADPEEVP